MKCRIIKRAHVASSVGERWLVDFGSPTMVISCGLDYELARAVVSQISGGADPHRYGLMARSSFVGLPKTASPDVTPPSADRVPPPPAQPNEASNASARVEAMTLHPSSGSSTGG